MHDENEKLKGQLLDASAIEKRAILEAERSRKDIDLIIQSREEVQQKSSLETATLRRDLHEHYVD